MYIGEKYHILLTPHMAGIFLVIRLMGVDLKELLLYANIVGIK